MTAHTHDWQPKTASRRLRSDFVCADPLCGALAYRSPLDPAPVPYRCTLRGCDDVAVVRSKVRGQFCAQHVIQVVTTFGPPVAPEVVRRPRGRPRRATPALHPSTAAEPVAVVEPPSLCPWCKHDHGRVKSADLGWHPCPVCRFADYRAFMAAEDEGAGGAAP